MFDCIPSRASSGPQLFCSQFAGFTCPHPQGSPSCTPGLQGSRASGSADPPLTGDLPELLLWPGLVTELHLLSCPTLQLLQGTHPDFLQLSQGFLPGPRRSPTLSEAHVSSLPVPVRGGRELLLTQLFLCFASQRRNSLTFHLSGVVAVYSRGGDQ